MHTISDEGHRSLALGTVESVYYDNISAFWIPPAVVKGKWVADIYLLFVLLPPENK